VVTANRHALNITAGCDSYPRSKALVFKPHSAGDFQGFHNHISFITKLVNIILVTFNDFFISFPILCICGAGFIFTINFEIQMCLNIYRLKFT